MSTVRDLLNAIDQTSSKVESIRSKLEQLLGQTQDRGKRVVLESIIMLLSRIGVELGMLRAEVTTRVMELTPSEISKFMDDVRYISSFLDQLNSLRL